MLRRVFLHIIFLSILLYIYRLRSFTLFDRGRFPSLHAREILSPEALYRFSFRSAVNIELKKSLYRFPKEDGYCWYIDIFINFLLMILIYIRFIPTLLASLMMIFDLVIYHHFHDAIKSFCRSPRYRWWMFSRQKFLATLMLTTLEPQSTAQVLGADSGSLLHIICAGLRMPIWRWFFTPRAVAEDIYHVDARRYDWRYWPQVNIPTLISSSILYWCPLLFSLHFNEPSRFSYYSYTLSLHARIIYIRESFTTWLRLAFSSTIYRVLDTSLRIFILFITYFYESRRAGSTYTFLRYAS